jgi:hypothetical protein
VADCTYVNAPAKAYCGLYQGLAFEVLVCDGQGNCTNPTVTCGADGECATEIGTCCVTGTSTTTCQKTSCGTTNFGINCDEKADCPPGYSCCFRSGVTGVGVSCEQGLTCLPNSMQTVLTVCNPSTPGECPSGTCQSNGTVPPYFVCKP